ncbi:uncharacterized protein LOC144150827 [Haemaphysalis longicornis]
MSSSDKGAVFATQTGRGNRVSDEENMQDYQVLLPQLPTGQYVSNTVFLHGDMRARPYRVEDFRDTLAHLALLPEVIALGAYQMNHVWAVTFSSAEGVKKILAAGDIKVKARRCLVVDPSNQELRLKVHWVLHGVPDVEVRASFAPYGNVTDVSREQWRVSGCVNKGSTTRLVTLKLKPGVTPDDLPHQLRIAKDNALVVVPGRPPLCLRCHRHGHVRRECRVPRCSLCRRFGHVEADCVPTYARVTGPAGSEDKSEHLMDEADAEEAAGGAGDVTLSTSTTPQHPGIDDDNAAGKTAEKSLPPFAPEGTENADAVKNEGSAAAATSSAEKSDAMEVSDAAASGVVSKRQRDIADGVSQNNENAALDEPPAKASTGRRATLRPKPNIPPDRRPAATPWASQTP